MPATGANHSRNSVCDANTSGMRKCISDHSSSRLFCSGVPVSSRRLRTHRTRYLYDYRTTLRSCCDRNLNLI